MKVSPSILTCDFVRLEQAITGLNGWGADELHLDVMDGVFVPNISFGPHMIASLRPLTSLPFDVHLMLQYPERLLDAFVKAGADSITIHIESSAPIRQTLVAIRERGCRAGLSCNPGTPPEALFPYLPLVDRVMVMTVQPGYGGQALRPECLPKITALRREIRRQGLTVTIEADGGINADNLRELAAAGCDEVVMGNALFNAPDPASTVAMAQGL